MLRRTVNYIISAFEKNPARFSGYISSISLYMNREVTWFPAELLIPSILLVIFVAESAQRYEDRKTAKALYVHHDPNLTDEEEIQILITRKQ